MLLAITFLNPPLISENCIQATSLSSIQIPKYYRLWGDEGHASNTSPLNQCIKSCSRANGAPQVGKLPVGMIHFKPLFGTSLSPEWCNRGMTSFPLKAHRRLNVTPSQNMWYLTWPGIGSWPPGWRRLQLHGLSNSHARRWMAALCPFEVNLPVKVDCCPNFRQLFYK